MIEQHYSTHVLSYAVALTGWFAAHRLLPDVWPPSPRVDLPRPRRELAIALLGAVGVLAVGQLWLRGVRLPETGAFKPLLGSVNQVMIFAPVLLIPLLRHQPWSTAWLGKRRLALRVFTGLVLSTLAVTAYALLRADADPPWELLRRIWTYDHIDELVQVFLEDVAIAILFVRLAAAIGSRRAIVLVACLFAAGHVPAMVTEGTTASEIAGLLRDAGLGAAAIFVLQRSRDIVWFWFVHFCMDMTQFDAVTFGL